MDEGCENPIFKVTSLLNDSYMNQGKFFDPFLFTSINSKLLEKYATGCYSRIRKRDCFPMMSIKKLDFCETSFIFNYESSEVNDPLLKSQSIKLTALTHIPPNPVRTYSLSISRM